MPTKTKKIRNDNGNEIRHRRQARTTSPRQRGVKPNGNIEAVDSLKICKDGFTKTELNVIHHTFNKALTSDLIQKYYNAHQDNVLCDKCKKCIIKNICGGGQLAHRYYSVNGFDNPSVYCKDISMLVTHIQNKLIDDLSKTSKEINIEKLTEDDFL